MRHAKVVLYTTVLLMGQWGASAVAADGTLKVRVVESGSDRVLPCRAWVTAGDQRLYKPRTATSTPYDRDRSFSCDGEFEMTVPAGVVTIHVERGKEYFPVDETLALSANAVVEKKIRLKRWIHMAETGWYSADHHVHFGHDDLDVLKQLVLADDVNWLPSFTYWNRFEQKWPSWPEGPNVFADAAHMITRRNTEIERIGGEPFQSVDALFVFGHTRPIHVDRHTKTFPPGVVFAQMARKMSPDCVMDTDKPLWAENVVTMGLGLFDTVQVCHNHYHRERTIHDGGLCCGMADASIEEEKVDYGEDELFHRTNSVYYRWLNCGYRLAVTGGSAMGVMAVPLGYCRTYAKLDGPLTEENYLKAMRAGRTFATSGPMLTLTADGQEMGATIKYETQSGKPLNVIARLQSIEPIERLEILHNDKVISRVDFNGRSVTGLFRRVHAARIEPKRSGWVAARAIYRNVHDGHLRQAHTSPIYIEVDGKPTASKRDAEYMIRWIDRLVQVSNAPKRYESDADREVAQGLFVQARQAYEQIARTAEEVWGD